jgi:CubicO group peptidase (beta-lactamase class C family)
MNFITPEQAGISSRHVLNFYKELEARHLSTHAVILSRGDGVFSECYYAPFHKDFLHRMYSTSKSFVSVAVGFCEQEGLLSLDDPLIKFFPEHKNKPYPHATSIRNMLQMTTDCPCPPAWFYSGTTDRTAYYFEHPPTKQAGTLFRYDSAGSFMLGAVVERVTGKPFLDYLREKVLNGIGFSQNATCLKCPGGHSWGDSGILCTARDLWLFARFVLNGGTWNGKRYLNAEYLKKATSPLVPTNAYGFGPLDGLCGYGYQFWCMPQGCFATLGMGNQIALCDPAHDFIMVINADNQGNACNYDQIFSAVYRHIIPHLGEPIEADEDACAALTAYTASQRLFSLDGPATSPFADRISGRTFVCEESPTGIRRFRLELADGEGVFHYENATGEKQFRFGFGHNVFEKFPEVGYSDLVGSVPAPGNRYDAAFSADWPTECVLRVRVQIIDKYFANMGILFAFRDESTVSVEFAKKAEAFLDEYRGVVNAHAK